MRSRHPWILQTKFCQTIFDLIWSKLFCHISPSRGLAATPAAESVPSESTHGPCWRKGPGPAPAASHRPDPLTSAQTEHPLHYERGTTDQTVWDLSVQQSSEATRIDFNLHTKCFTSLLSQLLYLIAGFLYYFQITIFCFVIVIYYKMAPMIFCSLCKRELVQDINMSLSHNNYGSHRSRIVEQVKDEQKS